MSNKKNILTLILASVLFIFSFQGVLAECDFDDANHETTMSCSSGWREMPGTRSEGGYICCERIIINSTDGSVYNETVYPTAPPSGGFTGTQTIIENYSRRSSSGSGWNPGGLEIFNLPNASVFDIVRNLLFWLLAIFGVVSIIGFVISGLIYLTAAGDETQAGRAKKAMTYSIIGIIVGLSGLVIIFAVDFALRGFSFF